MSATALESAQADRLPSDFLLCVNQAVEFDDIQFFGQVARVAISHDLIDVDELSDYLQTGYESAVARVELFEGANWRDLQQDFSKILIEFGIHLGQHEGDQQAQESISSQTNTFTPTHESPVEFDFLDEVYPDFSTDNETRSLALLAEASPEGRAIIGLFTQAEYNGEELGLSLISSAMKIIDRETDFDLVNQLYALLDLRVPACVKEVMSKAILDRNPYHLIRAYDMSTFVSNSDKRQLLRRAMDKDLYKFLFNIKNDQQKLEVIERYGSSPDRIAALRKKAGV